MRFHELKLCDLFVIPLPTNDCKVMAKTGVIRAQTVLGKNAQGQILYKQDAIEIHPNQVVKLIDKKLITNLV